MQSSNKKESCDGLERLLTSKEVSEWAKISERHIQNLIKKGEFPAPIRLGRSIRFKMSDVRTVLNGDFQKGLRNQAI